MDAATAFGTGPGIGAGQGVVEAAYASFGAELERRLTGMVRDPATAQDLAQEAFLRLHVEVTAGRTPDNIRAWLHRVGGNLVMSRGRHAQVVARTAPRLRTPEETASTEEIVVRIDGEHRLAAALAEMSPYERAVLMMAASGMSGPEIAVRTGHSATAMRTIICRARMRLRARVEELEATA